MLGVLRLGSSVIDRRSTHTGALDFTIIFFPFRLHPVLVNETVIPHWLGAPFSLICSSES